MKHVGDFLSSLNTDHGPSPEIKRSSSKTKCIGCFRRSSNLRIIPKQKSEANFLPSISSEKVKTLIENKRKANLAKSKSSQNIGIKKVIPAMK